MRRGFIAAIAVFALAPSLFASPFYGPHCAIRFVGGDVEDAFTERFVGGATAVVRVDSDFGATFSVFVHDASGQLIASDTDGDDRCEATWTPARDGAYEIRVKSDGAQSAPYRVCLE